MNKETKNKDINRLHNIWAIEEAYGEKYSEGMTPKFPTLEINLTENKVMGNDGCNQFFGGIEQVNADAITIGPLASTKMYCINAEFSDQVLKVLNEQKSYTISGGKLTLKNGNGDVIALFKPVD